MNISVSRVTSILTAGLAGLSSLGMAEQVQNPIRMQFSTEAFKMLFNRGDQRMLEALSNLQLVTDEQPLEKFGKCPQLSQATFDVKVADGIDVDTYDFDLSTNEAEYVGFEGKNLQVTGTAVLNDEAGTEVSFSAPIDTFKMEMEFVSEDNNEILKVNPHAEKPSVKDFTFDLGALSFADGNPFSADCVAEFHEGLIDGVLATYEKIWTGADMESLTKMPIESFLPLILFRQVGGISVDRALSDEVIEYGFDPEMLFERIRPTPAKKTAMLKEIHSEFKHRVESDDPVLLSVILDENAINSYILEFLMIERAFSLRQMAMRDDRLRMALKEMNTSTLKVPLPKVVEEFGEDRPLDLYVSMDHALIASKLDNTLKPSGF